MTKKARRRERFAHALALAILESDFTVEGMTAAARTAVSTSRRSSSRSDLVEERVRAVGDPPFPGAPRTWARRLARRIARTHRIRPSGALHELAATIAAGREIDHLMRERDWASRSPREPLVRRWAIPIAEMGARRWDVPVIATVGELARWLGLPAGDLDWMADRKGMNARATDDALSHYRARWIAKRSGGARLLEAPRRRLAGIQRAILHRVLDRIPVHEAAHGFVRGRSVHGFVAPHVDRDVVIRVDLEDFFASIAAGRVLGIFRVAGYPEEVARTLTALTTTRAHPRVLRRAPVELGPADRGAQLARLRGLHLPTGAPTSGALANLASFRLDARLSGLAAAMGGRFTRYADDLAFSWEHLARARVERFLREVTAIAREEGFTVAAHKTRVMRRGALRRLAGVTIDESPNVPRHQYDRLRAILHLSRRTRPEHQNRAGHPDFRAHLLGRIAWVQAWNRTRGARLRAMFARLEWDDPSA